MKKEEGPEALSSGQAIPRMRPSAEEQGRILIIKKGGERIEKEMEMSEEEMNQEVQKEFGYLSEDVDPRKLASVGARMGATVKLADFENFKYDCYLFVPTDPDRIGEASEKIEAFIDDRVDMRVEEAKKIREMMAQEGTA